MGVSGRRWVNESCRSPDGQINTLPAHRPAGAWLMTLEPVTPEVITSIVDDAFVPLARLSSGLSGSEA